VTLYLLPNFLGCYDQPEALFPATLWQISEQLDGLIAESDTGGRSFLTRFPTKKPARETPMALASDDIDFLLEPLVAGETWGLVSDAGMPGLADPGAKIVARARQKGIAVEAVSGPSSIMLALILSGFSGQRFAFHGYLRRDRPGHIQDMAQRAAGGETQLFIDAPYRNQATLEALVEQLPKNRYLAIASQLTHPDQLVQVDRVDRWQKLPDIRKKPTVFLIS
jgi:16S rRNA (cytidine1402-2'-O)-methyltransferase